MCAQPKSDRPLDDDTLRRLVYRRALQLLGNHHDAEEVTQDTLLAAVEARERGEVMHNPRAWLRRVTTNRAIQLLRARDRQRRLVKERVAPAVRDIHEESCEGLILMRGLLDGAPPEELHAAYLVYLCGMTQREAASRLGVSQRTVSNLLNQLRRRCLGMLELEPDGG